jgi:hypothetical protein
MQSADDWKGTEAMTVERDRGRCRYRTTAYYADGTSVRITGSAPRYEDTRDKALAMEAEHVKRVRALRPGQEEATQHTIASVPAERPKPLVPTVKEFHGIYLDSKRLDAKPSTMITAECDFRTTHPAATVAVSALATELTSASSSDAPGSPACAGSSGAGGTSLVAHAAVNRSKQTSIAWKTLMLSALPCSISGAPRGHASAADRSHPIGARCSYEQGEDWFAASALNGRPVPPRSAPAGPGAPRD